MKLVDYLWWSAKSLGHNKMRTALTVAGIVIGVAAIISLQAVGKGFQESIFEQLFKLSPDVVFVVPKAGSLTDADVARLQGVEGVYRVVPVVMGSVEVRGSAGYRVFELVGVSSRDLTFVIRGAGLEAGRYYQADFEAVVGYKVAYPPDLPYPFVSVGTSVGARPLASSSSKETLLKVVGVYEPIGASVIFNPDRTVFVSVKTAQALLGSSGYDVILVFAESPQETDVVASRIETFLGEKYELYTASQIRKIYDTIASQINNFLLAIAFISLIVAGVGIMNVLTINVIERTREIGVLKALGYTSNQVLLMFLSEAALIGIIGGLCGALLGVALSYASSHVLTFKFAGITVSEAVRTAPKFSAESFFLAFFFGLLVSLLSGAYPAYRAAKLDPVVALRYE